MKQEIITKATLFFAIAMALVNIGQTQEISTLMGWPAPQKSVVRQYTANQSIHYCNDGTNHYFVLYDQTNPTTAIVAQFPVIYDVNEFEIHNNMVYFCGVYPNGGNPKGIVGQISVYGLFYANLPYNIGYVDNLILNNDVTYAHMTSCDRMDVFEDINGVIHMAVVGELEHTNTYGNALRRTAADIWYTAPNWVGSVLYQKDDLYKPTDITCTNHTVVISAYDESLQHAILLVFTKVANFPAAPLFPYSIRIKTDLYNNDILVERLLDDDVAVAHYFEDVSYGTRGTALHYIPDVTTLPYPIGNFSLHYVHGTPLILWQKDLRFHKDVKGQLQLLHDIDSPVWGSLASAIYSFDAYNLPSLNLRIWYRLNSVELQSIDNRLLPLQCALSGIYTPTMEPLLSVKGIYQSSCYSFVDVNYYNVTQNVSFFTGDLDNRPLYYNEQGRNEFPNPQTYTINLICK